MSCPRSFEVEARRDGRLGGKELASFERHLAGCAACAEEARALEALGEALRAEPSRADELHVRRERTRLLATFDAALLARAAPRRSRPFVLAGAAALVLFAAFVVLWQAREEPAAGPAPLASRAASGVISVQAEQGSVWSRRTEHERELFVLESGELRIAVEHARRAPALLVLLPDGDLVDEGTTFSVRVEGGRTTRVAVEEGKVSLRLRGRPAVVIGAQQSWPFAEPAPDAVDSPRAEPSAPAAAAVSAVPAPAAVSAAPAVEPARPAPSAAVAAREARAAEQFRAAVSAFDEGRYSEASLLLTRFVSQHPRDPRSEDAAYLRVLAFRKTGDEPALQRAAKEYLRRFPSGFRRTEVEGMLR